ncbi:hypothetical protein FQR65_LT06425 [Abscondita terminalis]|nr:hypothetical protein FQR65_LT06425 [Abscondita terminalis]
MNATRLGYRFDTSFTIKGLLSNTPRLWLKNKRDADDLNGLWRIHDNIYDFTNFIQWHPGGQFWLEATKGTDITESFEIHHLKTNRSERLLKHFLIKPAPNPRLSPFTFADDGFYKTLKRNVEKTLNNVVENDITFFDTQSDVLLIITIILSMFSVIHYNVSYGFAAGLFAALTVTFNHSYVHKRDNLRMYYSDLLLIPSSDLRVSHIFNHHVFANNIIDMTGLICLFLTNLFLDKRSKAISLILGALFFWPMVIHVLIILKIVVAFMSKNIVFNADILLSCILPTLMLYLGSGAPQLSFIMYNFIIAVESFFLCLIIYTNRDIHCETNSDPLIFKESNDWGIYQLNMICKGDQKLDWTVAVGNCVLHYLFPTLDGSVFRHLYPVMNETLSQFNINVQFKSQESGFLRFLKQQWRNSQVLGNKNLKSD